MVLPEECEGYRFGVGHAEFGLMFFKPLSDSHLAQHLALLNIVPTEVCYMTKVTSENNGAVASFGRQRLKPVLSTIVRPGAISMQTRDPT